MLNKKITDVFFDLDHTLWDFDKNSGLAFQRVFRKHEIDIPLSDFLKVYEPINLEYWRMFREERVTKQELRRGRLSKTFDVLAFDYTIDLIDSLANSYIDELPGDNYLFSNTFETLDYLSGKYRLHIITNGFEEVQRKKIDNSGLKKYFLTITTSEEVGLKKPHPTVFYTAMEKASVTPDKSIMIGDSFEADILGAQNAGMHTLFYNYRNEAVKKPFIAVKELSEIKDYL
ncbi:noncanonical pyrimidine nucleotidase, YjjG family [Aequorivita sp. 609]|uniref:YjjG family noncanonical pyrimidine nucleotidase n=1 Tax=Aequorivita TaxID=153265 RepID=UPI0011227508|nr:MULTISPECIES: YjjG family noncanonical pyrimidine nucleotidase [Aequorivita]MBB6680540.1 noncanonical pyrimidine nucleotidase, YjjG family [Aequorivita sp. 609]